MEVKNKVVIVTGAGSGIGKAAAIHFASYGAIVVVSDINLDSAKKVADEIVTNGGESLAVKTDVTKFNEVEDLVHQTLSNYEKLDVIVNNAGIGPNLLPTHKSRLEDWDKVIAVNQTGVFYCMKVAIQQFLLQGHGNIVNIASLAGLKASPNNISYSASKFAVVGMTKSAAMEYATKNIRVNAVSPGTINTPGVKRYFEEEPSAKEALEKSSLLRRIGEPEEIGEMVAFLLSERSSFITGQIISVDGGSSIN